jgi:hypothetical protein
MQGGKGAGNGGGGEGLLRNEFWGVQGGRSPPDGVVMVKECLTVCWL